MGATHKAGEMTNAFTCTLFWKKSKLTIPLGNLDNVATFALAPGYSKFHAFCAQADITNDEDQLIICDEANIISNDEDEPNEHDLEDDPVDDSVSDSEGDTYATKSLPSQTEFNLDGPQTHCIPTYWDDDEDRQPSITQCLCSNTTKNLATYQCNDSRKWQNTTLFLENLQLVLSLYVRHVYTQKQPRSLGAVKLPSQRLPRHFEHQLNLVIAYQLIS